MSETKASITLFADGRVRVRPLPYGKSVVVQVGKMYIDELKKRVLADIKHCRLGLDTFTATHELSGVVRKNKLAWVPRSRVADVFIDEPTDNGEESPTEVLMGGYDDESEE